MHTTRTLSQRPDAVVQRWLARLQHWWQSRTGGDALVIESLRALDDRTLRDIGLERLAARRSR